MKACQDGGGASLPVLGAEGRKINGCPKALKHPGVIAGEVR
jgi:hypothetical protein